MRFGPKFLFVPLAFALLAACGDDDSDFLVKGDDSSDVELSGSSGSERDSGSSVSSSGSKARSSSSAKSGSGTSEASQQGSLVPPCRTETEDNCKYITLKDERDGKEYKAVEIGNQVWMAENLNYEMEESYCYEDSLHYCEKYGRLYPWYVAMDADGLFSSSGKGCHYNAECSPTYPVRGICPDGWHLPSKADWDTLLLVVGGSNTEGKKLKASTVWGEEFKGTDEFGFSALPGSHRMHGGSMYIWEGSYAYFWTSSDYKDNFDAYKVMLRYDYDDAIIDIDANKAYAFSVRCLRDKGVDNMDYDLSFVASETFFNPDVSYGELVDERDGQVYKTVKIEDQEWMAENLNFETENSYNFEYDLTYRNTYGRFYSWSEAMDSAGVFSENGKDCGEGSDCTPTYPVRGICPSGWHLPSSAEWDTLLSAVGGYTGRRLKSTSGWFAKGNGTNDVGFSAAPTGAASPPYGFCTYEGAYTEYWSSDICGRINVYCLLLSYDEVYAKLRHDCGKTFFLSIRCLKD